MDRVKSPILALFAALALSSCATLPGRPALIPPPAAAVAWTAVGRGVDYVAFASVDPRVEAHVARVDLSAPGLVPVVTPGQNGTTLSQYVSSFARLHDCVVAINTAPFRPSSAIEGEKRTVVGYTVADGVVVSPPFPPKAVLFLRRAGDGGFRAEIALQTPGMEAAAVGEPLVAAAAGFSVVLSRGLAQGGRGPREPREPRTAAGISADGRTLYLLVADGRRPDSAGLTNYEVGLWLGWLGAESGMTLDGGGSSAMALRGKDGMVRIANLPVDAGQPGRERAVGSCLGFISSWEPVGGDTRKPQD
jgi:hypothetical protein